MPNGHHQFRQRPHRDLEVPLWRLSRVFVHVVRPASAFPLVVAAVGELEVASAAPQRHRVEGALGPPWAPAGRCRSRLKFDPG